MLSGRNQNLLAIAQAAALNSTYRYRLGAIIVSGNRVRGVGWSKRRNKPANVSVHHIKECSTHAEVDALRGLPTLKRATCFVARLDAYGYPTLAKPCDECWGALTAAGVVRVYWTINREAVGVSRIEGVI